MYSIYRLLTNEVIRIKKEYLQLSHLAGENKDGCNTVGFKKAAASCYRLLRYREFGKEKHYG